MKHDVDEATARGAAFARVTSGNKEADEILGGGFPVNSINVIMGHPGTGKTIFVEQMIFSNAGSDRPILYLTTLSEPLPKVIKYLQRFHFFDEEKLGISVIYEDIGPPLAKNGLAALLPALKEAIDTHAPKIIVIDSFKALHDVSTSVIEMRLMLYELTGMLTAYDTTAFLVGEYSEDHSRLPEFAVADGIIQFLRRDLSSRDERYLRVLKLRGSRYLEGLHAFRIGDAGLHIYPRLVTPEIPTSYELLAERVSTGVPGLDPILDGGLWRGSTTLIAGSSGAGKTTMGLQFAIEGLQKGEPSLYINLQENPMQIARQLRTLGIDAAEAYGRGFYLQYESPVELQIDSVIVKIFRLMEEKRLQRVIIDSVGDLMNAASDAHRLHDYLYSLVQHFAVKRTTCILTLEASFIDPDGTGSVGRFSYMSDNVIHLMMDPAAERQRTVTVLKSRGSAHDLSARPFELTASGARVL